MISPFASGFVKQPGKLFSVFRAAIHRRAIFPAATARQLTLAGFLLD
jgi:hypothetical protein